MQLHPWAVKWLVADNATTEQPANGGWTGVAVRLLRAGLPEAPSHDPTTWPRWAHLLPLVLTATDPTRPLEPVTADVGWLLDGAAGYLQARGQPGPARALFEDARGCYRKPARTRPPRHPRGGPTAGRRHARPRTSTSSGGVIRPGPRPTRPPARPGHDRAVWG